MRRFLVVVDIQNDFTTGSLGSAEAVVAAERAAEVIREFDGDIFVTYDTHFDTYLDTEEGRRLPVKHCIEGTEGHELHPLIKDALEGKKFTEVKKYTFGSLKLPKLILREALDEEFSVTLIGLCTDICVVSNALLLKAHFPSSNISIVRDACAGVTPESHEAALLTMKMCQIDVI